MTIRVVRASALVRMPWKNGGGTTAEVAVSPPGAGLEGFDWRLSMADVTSEGPFSSFPGIDRTLVLVEGPAVDIVVDGIVHRLDGAGGALSFPGEGRTSARLPLGPIRDLNVMTRRSVFSHRLADPDTDAPCADAILVLVSLRDGNRVAAPGVTYSLDRLDVLLVDPWSERLLPQGPSIALELRRITSSPA